MWKDMSGVSCLPVAAPVPSGNPDENDVTANTAGVTVQADRLYGGKLGAQGLEPWTHGLKGRCSTD